MSSAVAVDSQFAGGGTRHQIADGFLRRFALLQDGVHLLGDGHLDAHLARQAR